MDSPVAKTVNNEIEYNFDKQKKGIKIIISCSCIYFGYYQLGMIQERLPPVTCPFS